ncbi:MAG TPA: radical SAM protein [Bacteroidales bacterium]|nr:radical SAM protein [Bacteroidales bacterium]HPS16107.1 radical SAM protein [Bacteroidales bacterium]
MSIDPNRFYLLYPPITKQERYSSEIGNAGGDQIPLGIYYLASYLRLNHIEIKVRDAEANKLSSQEIISEINSFSPKFVGISSTTVAFHRAVEIAKEIKKHFNDVIIILGGPHVTANPNHAMSFAEFDFGVLHEGEYTLIELIKTINENGDLKNVKGITYREQTNISINPLRAYIENLDQLPFPAFDLIDNINLYTPPPSNYKTLPVVNMITSRGCPSQCTFCDNNIFGRKYRQRSAENIVEEIKLLRKNYNIREIAFVDDTFLIDKKRIYKLFELLDKENISFYWTCMSRINNTDYEFLNFIKSKGCWHISFGIESGDENILKLIKKNISLDKAKEVINWCKKLKIKTKGFFIIGHPTETIETIDKTIKLACRLNLDDIVVTINTPIPGSQQYTEAELYGSIDKTNWAEFNYWRPVFVPKGLTKEILLSKHKEIYRKFYLRPRILLRYFFSFFGKGGFKRFKTVFKASFFILKNKK